MPLLRSECCETQATKNYDAVRLVRPAILLPDRPVICPTGKSPISLSSPLCKNFLLRRRPKSDLDPTPSRPTEGRFAIVTNVVQGMRWTRQHRRNWVFGLRNADERRCSGARRRWATTPRRRRQVGNDLPATVTNKPDHRGEHEGNR